MTTNLIDIQNSDVIMATSNMAENHPVGFQWVMKAKERGAKFIHVDPRFTRTSAAADIHVPIRSGTNIAFFGGLINYAIQNNLYFKDYVVHYTNAPYLIDPAFKTATDGNGLFTGFDAAKGTYDRTSWKYQLDGEGNPKRDLTLKDPNSVFQLMRRHYSRYTPQMVERVCGIPQAKFEEVAKLFCSNSGPEKTGTITYALNLTQHTNGVENIRALCMLQLLLGNIGRPGGGVTALRGHANVQGATDLELLYHELPGYMAQPLRDVHPALRRLFLEIGLEIGMHVTQGLRHVPGQLVVEQLEVGRALHVGVAAERGDPAPGTADVPEQDLQHTQRADVLHAVGVLGEVQRVRDGPRLFRTGGAAVELGHLLELRLRDAAHPFDHIQGVAAVVTLHELEDGVRILQREIAPGVALAVELVLPARPVIGLLGRVVSGEETVEVGGRLERRVDQERGVRVVDDVVLEVEVVLDGVVDQTAEEHDVGAAPGRHVDVGGGPGSREAGVDVNELGAPLLGLHHPLESHRVIFGHVGGRHDDIRVLDVDEIRRHRAPPERGPQSWDRGGVSDSGLVFVVDDAEGPVQLAQQIALLVVGAGRPERGDRLQPVHQDLLAFLRLLLLDEILLTRVVIALGHLLVHPLQRLLLPLVRTGRPIERLGGPKRVVGELDGGRALRAQGAERVGRVGIALDVDDLVVLGVDELAAAHGAVRTHASEDFGFLDPQGRRHRFDRGEVEPVGADGDPRRRRGSEFEKVASRQTHDGPP